MRTLATVKTTKTKPTKETKKPSKKMVKTTFNDPFYYKMYLFENSAKLLITKILLCFKTGCALTSISLDSKENSKLL